MGLRPQVLLVGADEQVRMWLLQSGADPVTDPDDDLMGVVRVAGSKASDFVAVGLPELVEPKNRTDVINFVRGLRGRDLHDFDDHGSAQAWPRGTFHNW